MNDQDRGAYTPGGERPLAFDARGGSRGGGGGKAPVPLTLIGSAGVLVVVVVGLVLAYRGGGHAGGEPRTVGDPVASIKTAAAPGATPKDPAAAMDVYAAQNVPAAKPSFAPPPETPAARPAPSKLTVRTVDPAKVRIEPAEPTQTAEDKVAASTAATTIKAGAADKPVALAKAKTPPAATEPKAEKVAITAKSASPTKTVAAEAPAKATIAETTATGGSVVQIGAFSSRELADKEFSAVAGLMASKGHGKSVVEVDHEGKTLYRTAVTGFADRAAAKAFCDALQAKGRSCIVKG